MLLGDNIKYGLSFFLWAIKWPIPICMNFAVYPSYLGSRLRNLLFIHSCYAKSPVIKSVILTVMLKLKASCVCTIW